MVNFKQLTPWEDLEKELMKNPRFKKLAAQHEHEFELACSLIDLRLKKGLTQKQLAKKIGTKQPVISRLEGMVSKPSLSLLERISEALGVKLRIYFQS